LTGQLPQEGRYLTTPGLPRPIIVLGLDLAPHFLGQGLPKRIEDGGGPFSGPLGPPEAQPPLGLGTSPVQPLKGEPGAGFQFFPRPPKHLSHVGHHLPQRLVLGRLIPPNPGWHAFPKALLVFLSRRLQGDLTVEFPHGPARGASFMGHLPRLHYRVIGEFQPRTEGAAHLIPRPAPHPIHPDVPILQQPPHHLTQLRAATLGVEHLQMATPTKAPPRSVRKKHWREVQNVQVAVRLLPLIARVVDRQG